jgi:hypothetical protein
MTSCLKNAFALSLPTTFCWPSARIVLASFSFQHRSCSNSFLLSSFLDFVFVTVFVMSLFVSVFMCTSSVLPFFFIHVLLPFFFFVSLTVMMAKYCPHTRRKSLLGMRYTRMRKISRRVATSHPESIYSTTTEQTTGSRLSCVLMNSVWFNVEYYHNTHSTVKMHSLHAILNWLMFSVCM